MDSETEEDFTLKENYYTNLNLNKNATIEEINGAYRSLSRIYHPDKHIDIEKKDKAELIFNRIKRAYEVLSDPHKRAIYDSLGVKGLETEGWEIINRTKTPAEIREEYERLAREREERRLLQRTNPRGNITVNVNATEIFNSYDDDFDSSFLPPIEISGMSISQSIEAPITLKDTITMSGNLSTQNGVGNGAFLISGRRLINKGWLELDVGAGNGPVINFKGSRNLSQRIVFNGGALLSFRSNGILPGLVGTLAVQLDKHTVGYLTYNAGIQTSMATTIEHNSEKQHCALTLTIGIPHCFIAGSYTRKLIEHELKLRLSAKFGTFGYSAEYGAEKKISKYSSVFASVTVGHPTGVTLRLKLIRSSQSYIFPIHLSEEIIPAAIFYATVTPLICWFVVKKTILEPMDAAQKQHETVKIKDQNKKRMLAKKQEAEAAIDLMLAQYERMRNDEDKRKGLIILFAKYGYFFDATEYSSSSWTPESIENSADITIDVTIPLQCLVKDSKLILQSSSKSDLPGFYDPCIGENKQLIIIYTHKDVMDSVIVSDNESIRLPKDKSTSTG